MGWQHSRIPFHQVEMPQIPMEGRYSSASGTVFLDDWNGDDSGKTGHLRMEPLFFSIQTVLLKGMATTPCNPVTYMFVIVKVIKEKGVILTFHGRNSWDDGDVKVYKGKVCCSLNSVTLIVELNLNLNWRSTVFFFAPWMFSVAIRRGLVIRFTGAWAGSRSPWAARRWAARLGSMQCRALPGGCLVTKGRW
jgi:hypothetical protein